MSAAPWPLAEIEIIGGHCCPRPPAPFGRGAAVVRRLDDPNSIRIAYTLDSRGAAGDPLTEPQWRGLVETFNALALPEPAPATPHTALWVFTEVFGPTLGACLGQLRDRKTLVAQHPKSPTLQIAASDAKDNQGVTLALVDESRAHPFRLQWRNLAHDDAWKHLQRGDLDDAQRHAERALSLLPEPSAEDLALLSLIYSRNDRLTRSTALLAAAKNSYGAEFCRQLDVDRQRMLADLASLPPTAPHRETQVPSSPGHNSRRILAIQASQEKTKR